MRVLLDRNVPDQMRRHLRGHAVRTTEEHGWNRLTNGDLLKIAEAERFDVLVTADQNLAYQQNLKDRKISLVVLGTNRLSLLEAEPDRIRQAVNAATVGGYQLIEYQLPPKQKRRPPSDPV